MQLPGATPFEPALAERLEQSLRAKGPDYRPRTEHLQPDGRPKYVNRLILETSPYLLQHAHNPVSWFPWGEEAFELAKRLDRPVFLSVGYSTCHWCHVMEVESFEDEEIASTLNSLYIPIKVDREERPDVDGVYMTVVQLMTRHGGWPMTVIMTPEKRPFFGGTYFPARDGDRGARVGFLTVLKRIHQAYSEDREGVLDTAAEISRALETASAPAPPSELPRADAISRAVKMLASRFDSRHGGFGGAPKFPQPAFFELLLRYWRRTGETSALEMVTRSLDSMRNGGIYDQIGGGFHRYSTDAEWLVPHFEKMLYDNAQLVSVLIDTYQATREPRFAETAREVLDYVAREMTSDSGAFYSATDADSEGHEGLFFVWTPAEIEAVLGAERARAAIAYFGVTDRGNFEGKNILFVPRPDAQVAKDLGLDVAALRSEIARARRDLYEARKKRIPPLLDDKVIVEWNGQMISAFARAGFVLAEPDYVRRAERAADFVLTRMNEDGRLLRTHRAGASKHKAVLEDYAFFIAGLIDLFEATSEPRWLAEALRLEETLERYYLDAQHGGFYGTASDAEVLLVREKPIEDGAQPSGNSLAVLNLLRLAELTGDARHRTTAEGCLVALGGILDHGLAAPKLLAALDFYLDKPKEIVLARPRGGDDQGLVDVVRRTFVPNHVLVRIEDGADGELGRRVPMIEDKRALGGQPTAYVCFDRRCLKPTSSPEELAKQLEAAEPLGP